MLKLGERREKIIPNLPPLILFTLSTLGTSRRVALELEEPLQGATTSTTRIYTSFPLSSLTYFLANLHVAHTFPLTLGTNNPQKTTELFSFGRLKEEKTRSHLHPLCEAITPT
ncbi:hypothetical protein Taro_032623 [Colocasia esculenta]|uniref:Uncharacterized protein n=1 Tax=Colocasia esculenta TaxID=4460 RepID=A0A843VT43_COLES|nr:hypothetical protein [Colocasia esculenta]